MKLWEINWNLVCVHLEGSKNNVADYLSRIHFVEEKVKSKNEFGPKSAQHVKSPFPILSVITKEQILTAFQKDPTIVTPCKEKDPEACPENVRQFIS